MAAAGASPGSAGRRLSFAAHGRRDRDPDAPHAQGLRARAAGPRGDPEELLELARWAPNHHLTAPWRFRVVGPEALARLKEAAGPEGAAKLDRAPTLIVVSCALGGDPVQNEEDLHATAVASYIVLLAAHARGLAGYWRTPGLLRSHDGRAAVGLADDERFVGLLHLGRPRQEKDAPGAARRSSRRPSCLD